MQIVVIVIVFLVVVGVFAFFRSRQSNDGVEGFRRQIDALSSDARRPTIDRRNMPGAEGDAGATVGQPDPDDAEATDVNGGAETGESPGTSRDAATIDPGFARAPIEPHGEPAGEPADQSRDESSEAETREDDPNGS